MINLGPVENLPETEWRRLLWDKLEAIEAHGAETNGRVGALERWQSKTLGGLAVIAVVLAPMLAAMLV